MKEDFLKADNLIPVHRLSLFLNKMIDALEAKDKDMAKKIKVLKKRGNRGIEIGADAKKIFQLQASQAIMDSLIKGVNVLYIKEQGCRITKEILDKAEML